jgi:uncharacterized protein YndB with AHSA1/START domain
MLHSVMIDRPPEAVYDFACTPAHWPHWHPSSLRLFGSVDAPLAAGARFEEDVRAGGRSGHLVWTVEQAERARRWIATAEVDNGARLRLGYQFAATATGTAFQRELVYDLPHLWLDLLNLLVLRRRIAAESALSLTQLRQTLEHPVAGAPV